MSLSIEDRFWSKINKNGTIPINRPDLGPCWEWMGAPDSDGYGRFWTKNHTESAHRFSYELHVGIIKNNRTIDHLCLNKICVNPSHLEEVTRLENYTRSIGGIGDKQTGICKYGHSSYKENAQGGWECLECRKITQIKYKIKNNKNILPTFRICRICKKFFAPRMHNSSICGKRECQIVRNRWNQWERKGKSNEASIPD